MSAVRGLLLIFDVEEYPKNPAKNRIGSYNDSQDLKNTFELMNAHVIIKYNPSSQDIRDAVKEIKKMDFSSYQYVAVAYLSHGGEDEVVDTSDDLIIHFQKTVLIPLCRLNALNGKLKWLIMQTCRGSYDFIGQQAEGSPDKKFYDRYCAKFFATTQGMKAYRAGFKADDGTTEYRSFFIRYLCKTLRERYQEDDIITIMNKTRDEVIAETRPRKIEQKPAEENNFGSKKFYLSSGFQSSY